MHKNDLNSPENGTHQGRHQHWQKESILARIRGTKHPKTAPYDGAETCQTPENSSSPLDFFHYLIAPTKRAKMRRTTDRILTEINTPPWKGTLLLSNLTEALQEMH
jgi:hypothetical protein